MTMQSRVRVAVVTGASSGIGKATAGALAAQGWQVIALGRDPARSAAAKTELRAAAAAGGSVEMIIADLALLREAERAAGEIAARTDRVDVLINNAGGVAAAKRVTDEGNEATFAGNHLGPFLLTQRLLPLLRRAAAEAPRGSVRIINVSSNASEMTSGLDWDDLQSLDNFTSGRAYCNAKLANVLFARGLARRLAADGIVAHALHPGVVASNFASHADAAMQAYIRTLEAQTPEAAAAPLLWLATDPEPGRSSGGYYHGQQLAAPNPLADDPAVVDRLWAESERRITRG